VDSRRFLVTLLASVLLVCGALAAINVRLDVYAAFGDARGKERRVVTEERWTKYMYTFNYIPANFDGLLIGSSIGDNLDTSRIRGYRVYNACLAGGSGAEADRMTSSALAHGMKLRLLLVSLDVQMLKDASLKAGGMEPRDYWSALGSTHLLVEYAAEAGVRAGLLPDPWSAYGVQDYEKAGLRHVDAELATNEHRNLTPEERLVRTDDSALRELGALLARARDRGARIVGFLPPLYEPIYRLRDVHPLERAARALLTEGERVVDFNDGTFPEITTDPASFLDGAHLTNAGAAKVTEALVAAVDRP
jgi:hypothetical protein